MNTRLQVALVLICVCGASPTPAAAQWSTGSGKVYTTTSSDKVGIGTNSPESLDSSGNQLVVGSSGSTNQGITINAGGYPRLYFANGASYPYQGWLIYDHSNNAMWFGTDHSTRMTIGSTGNVGIGSGSPTSSRLRATTGNAEDFAGYFENLDNSGNVYVKLAGASGYGINSVFMNGKVLVGSTSSSSSAILQITGDVTVSGNIGAKYQDVAEWVDSRETLSAGTVVILDSSATGVSQSNTAYDTTVAGVISPQPGLILGEKKPGRVMVAQSGRVRVKADATYGAIRPGDLLVTSATPGYAMRSTPLDVAGVDLHRPGTLLGKAIEPLLEGQGEILVLVTLQ